MTFIAHRNQFEKKFVKNVVISKVMNLRSTTNTTPLTQILISFKDQFTLLPPFLREKIIAISHLLDRGRIALKIVMLQQKLPFLALVLHSGLLIPWLAILRPLSLLDH
jgi:hypothetical protein